MRAKLQFAAIKTKPRGGKNKQKCTLTVPATSGTCYTAGSRFVLPCGAKTVTDNKNKKTHITNVSALLSVTVALHTCSSCSWKAKMNPQHHSQAAFPGRNLVETPHILHPLDSLLCRSQFFFPPPPVCNGWLVQQHIHYNYAPHRHTLSPPHPRVSHSVCACVAWCGR